jgi:hypothetical protein
VGPKRGKRREVGVKTVTLQIIISKVHWLCLLAPWRGAWRVTRDVTGAVTEHYKEVYICMYIIKPGKGGEGVGTNSHRVVSGRVGLFCTGH